VTATTADELALLRGVLEAPDDDTPRLVLADWLEENAGVVPCPRCLGRGAVGWDYVNGVGQPPKVHPCPECTQPNYVPVPDGRAARAELIRVQCELAATADEHGDRYWDGQLGDGPESYRRRKALRRREGELVRALWPDSKMFADGVQVYLPGFKLNESIGAGATTGTVRCGFIESVTLSWEAWAGGPCQARGPHHHDPCSGGRVQSPNAQFTQECRACNGEGRTAGMHRDLIWWPGAVDVCPGCKGVRLRCRNEDNPDGLSDIGVFRPSERNLCTYCGLAEAGHAACPQCSGQGTVPRPVPPTAQPVTHVTITGEFPVDQGFVLATTMASAGRQTWFNPRWPTVTFTLPA
jgi:hypothetical protein